VLQKLYVIKNNLKIHILWSFFSVAFMSSHDHYYKDLKRSDFDSDEKYLEERVKRGLQAGYTFQQCFEHWLEDFKQALYNASSQDQTNDE